MGKKKKESSKKEPEKEIILDSEQIFELKKSQKTPQELLNERLNEHETFNQKIVKIVSNIVERQKNTINSYKKEASKYKSVSVLKKIVLKFKEIFEVKFKKNKKQIEEIDILSKQVLSSISEITKGEQSRTNIVKFLKIPYKKDYHANDINEILAKIEKEETTKEEAKKAAMLYKKRLIEAINSYYELQKLNDYRQKYFVINEKYDLANILESKQSAELQKQNEELIYALFKLLKTNTEITLLIDENVKQKEHSKLFINFVKELNEKLESSYDSIGKKELDGLLEEIKEEELIDKTKEEMEDSKEILEKTIDEEINKGNEDIAKTLIDATPKEHKK